MIFFTKLLNKKFYFQYKLLIFLILLYCYGCSNNKRVFIDNKNIQTLIKTSCPISDVVDINKNIIVGTLYYKNNSYKLSEKDKEVLQQIITLFEGCHKKIIVIGYCSNEEAFKSPHQAAKISYYRAINAYNYLKQSIPNNYLFFGFLSNFKNKYIEDNKTAVFGNQRVEIVMLGSGISSLNILDKN